MMLPAYKTGASDANILPRNYSGFQISKIAFAPLNLHLFFLNIVSEPLMLDIVSACEEIYSSFSLLSRIGNLLPFSILGSVAFLNLAPSIDPESSSHLAAQSSFNPSLKNFRWCIFEPTMDLASQRWKLKKKKKKPLGLWAFTASWIV